MSSVFNLAQKRQSPDPKLFVSTSELPRYVDPQQPPTKKSPWKQISSTPYVQGITMTMPEELYALMWNQLERMIREQRYAKVIMRLEDVLEGEFFTEYIKKGKDAIHRRRADYLWKGRLDVAVTCFPVTELHEYRGDALKILRSCTFAPGSASIPTIRCNILMLSEGQPGINNLFSLRDGILRLNLDKQSYERAGLQGQPIRSGGRKHVKERFLVEIDLRQPSMLHGKNGFERLVWAAKNVLNTPLLWLFHDLNGGDIGPLQKHHPTLTTIPPQITSLKGISVPPSLSKPPSPSTLVDEEDLHELIEWLDLLALDSPRIRSDDTADPHISRYSMPEDSSPDHSLRVIQWTGFISGAWVTQLLISTIKQWKASGSRQWFALSASAYTTEAVGQGNGYTVVFHPSPKYGVDVRMGEGEGHIDQGTDEKSGGGERFTCFQFIDS